MHSLRACSVPLLLPNLRRPHHLPPCRDSCGFLSPSAAPGPALGPEFDDNVACVCPPLLGAPPPKNAHERERELGPIRGSPARRCLNPDPGWKTICLCRRLQPAFTMVLMLSLSPPSAYFSKVERFDAVAFEPSTNRM